MVTVENPTGCVVWIRTEPYLWHFAAIYGPGDTIRFYEFTIDSRRCRKICQVFVVDIHDWTTHCQVFASQWKRRSFRANGPMTSKRKTINAGNLRHVWNYARSTNSLLFHKPGYGLSVIPRCKQRESWRVFCISRIEKQKKQSIQRTR